MAKPTAAHRVNHRPGPHRLHPGTPPTTTHNRAALGPAAARAGATGADPLAHQPHHPRARGTVSHQPIPVDRVIHHVVAVLGQALRPDPDHHSDTHPWIIDGTLIPVHDQSITAISTNYRRSVNAQIIICPYRRRVVIAGRCWPGNRNDVIVARHTVTHLFDDRVVLGDGGYRGIMSITTPRRDATVRSSTMATTGHTPCQGPRRTRHRPTQGLADTTSMPTPRPGHQPQPLHHRRTLEPQGPHTIAGHH